jgi:hypothetical protein
VRATARRVLAAKTALCGPPIPLGHGQQVKVCAHPYSLSLIATYRPGRKHTLASTVANTVERNYLSEMTVPIESFVKRIP